MVVYELVVVLPPSVVVQAIDTPLEVAPGGVFVFSAQTC